MAFIVGDAVEIQAEIIVVSSDLNNFRESFFFLWSFLRDGVSAILLLGILLWWVLSSATACIAGNASAANPNLDRCFCASFSLL